MNERAAELIRYLNLKTHPEGGFFSEMFRSSEWVTVSGTGEERAALTIIYFLLTADSFSRWHVLDHDEVWHFHEGDPLELFTVDPERMKLTRSLLGRVAEGQAPARVVPAGHWQAARSTGDYTLAGCSVGPGFEYEDFRMIRDDTQAADRLRRSLPDLSGML